MSIKSFDLSVDKNLLDPKFDGYKLSLNPIESSTEKLCTEIYRVEPNVDQYSFIHAKLFALHNYLISDPWNDRSVYFVDKNWYIQKYSVDPTTYEINSTSIWKIPESRKQPIYNISLIFSSENTVVISDGSGILHIIDTGNRSQCQENWKLVFTNEFDGMNIGEFVVLDAKCLETEKRILNCILMTIEPNLTEPNRKNMIVLNWITLNESSDKSSWGVTEIEQLRGNEIHFCAFNTDCSAIYIASNGQFKFLNESKQEPPKPIQKLYKWQQTREDITITLKMIDLVKKDLKIESSPFNLKINLKDTQILEFNLTNRIDSDLTTWEIKDQLLQITAYKEEVGLMWSKIDENNHEQGEQIVDQSLVEEIHARLENLCSDVEVTDDDLRRNPPPMLSSQQLEECDMLTDSMLVLERLERKNHAHTHTVTGIGGYQVLFQVQNNDVGEAQCIPRICLRHDVDACIFQFDENQDNLKIYHVGTINAFGYVQASKQQKKYIGCSPDMSYGVIAESSRHIFIYRQHRDVTDNNTCQLRNRATGHRVNNIAEQQLINLTSNTSSNDDEIYGLCIKNHVLFILKSKHLYFYYI